LAIIPLKPPGQRKSRLAGRLSAEARDRLAEAMFHHVACVLRAVPAIVEIALLCECALPGWPARWIRDEGRGLNAELRDAAISRRSKNLLVIHPDLPLLAPADIVELIASDHSGSAIAPDRHGTGTNALALRGDAGFEFAFGAQSFARHLARAGGKLRVVERPGLALDVDTPEDFDSFRARAEALGFPV
jgi:2-phospho-L-lactate guanylyltransferase